MKQVYSRWPTGPLATQPAPAVSPEDYRLPAWITATRSTRRQSAMRGLRSSPLLYAALAALPVAAVILLISRNTPGGLRAVSITLGVVAAMLSTSLWQTSRLAARAMEADRRFAAVFERAGISNWLEDWRAVGQAIMELQDAGVLDVQAYFTAHPELARALRRQVIIKDVNAFTVEMMGAPGKHVFIGSLDRVLPDTDQTFMQWLVAFGRGDRFYRSETHIIRPDGSAIDVLFTAALPDDLDGFANILVSCLDISDYKAAQARLISAETEIARVSRITTVGALTASIAHEINSPLAAIVSNAEACLRWLRLPEPDLAEAAAAVTNVVRDAGRTRDVVARTRSFLKRSLRQLGPIDIVEAIENAVTIIDRELRRYGISLHFDADEALPPVVADPIEMQQVMVNLIINGAQAMSEVQGPRDLTVTARRDGGNVHVAVRDRGCGIAAELLPRIFDPFYTTKSEGMGMGLAICRNCIEALGGRLWAESAIGAGTTVHFRIPAAGQPCPAG